MEILYLITIRVKINKAEEVFSVGLQIKSKDKIYWIELTYEIETSSTTQLT